MQATFDHGSDDGFGLWLDPAVEDDPVYSEHWAGPPARRGDDRAGPDRDQARLTLGRWRPPEPRPLPSRPRPLPLRARRRPLPGCTPQTFGDVLARSSRRSSRVRRSCALTPAERSWRIFFRRTATG